MHKNFTSICIILMTVFYTPKGFAELGTEFAQGNERLKIINAEMRKKVLPMLLIIKELDKDKSPAPAKIAKVIQTSITVRETHNPQSDSIFTAQMSDNFPILTKHDQWYQIVLLDGREGWIHENAVQVIISQEPTVSETEMKFTDSQRQEMYALISDWMSEINNQNKIAAEIFSTMQQTYNNLTLSEKQQHFASYESIIKEDAQIAKYYTYARHFYQPYDKIINEVELMPSATFQKKFRAQASLNLGKSSYDYDKKYSETARNINLNGVLTLDERSQVAFGLNSRKEVIATPFSTNDFFVGYVNRLKNGLHIDSRVSYNNYSAEKSARNNFGRFGARINAKYPLKSGTQLFGYFNHINKNFKEEAGNSYASNQFNFGARMKKSRKKEIIYNFQGMIQSSDINYLKFNRFTPRIRYIQHLSGNRVFGAIADIDYIGYGEEMKSNNYIREKIDLKWADKSNDLNKTKHVKFLLKQFPNNDSFNYFKLSGDYKWQQGVSGFGLATSNSIYALITYFPKGEGQVDYIDLRYDRLTSTQDYYFDFNIYGRFWSRAGKASQIDNVLNLYSRIGPIVSDVKIGPVFISRLKVGPTLAAHICYNKDEEFIKKDGNSIRFGFEFQGYFRIKNLTGNFAYIIEKSHVYGHEVEIDVNTGDTEYGKLVKRNPKSVQFRLGARAPVTRDLDFQLNISFFNIELDVDEKTSINPIENRSKMNFMGGLVYRFDVFNLYENIMRGGFNH